MQTARPILRATPIVMSALLVAGCFGGSSGGARATGPSGIRGTELQSFACDADPDGKALRVSPAQVLELRVCPIEAPEPFNRPNRAVSNVRGGAGFSAFLSALSLRDDVGGKNQMCPEYAELLPKVIARTSNSAVLVHLPSDACGHTLPAVRTLLNRAINSASATPPNATM